MTVNYEGLRPLKLLGSLLEVVRIFFRKNGFKIEWKPNQAHTYTGDMTYEFPAPDTDTTTSDILVSEKSEQTLKNKTINFNPLVGGNTAQDVPLSSMKTDNTQAGKVIMRDGSGVMTHGQVAESQLASGLADKINAKAEQSDVEDLQDEVVTLNAAVAAKASNNTVSALEDRVETLEAGGGVDLSSVEGRLDDLEADPVTKTYVDGQISGLINSAPATLDTLKEIADQLAADESVAAALATTVGTKASQSDLTAESTTRAAADTALSGRVNTLEAYGFYSATWYAADGATKTISHNLGRYVEVFIYDSNGQLIHIDNVMCIHNSLVLTASQAPDAANWEVKYRKAQ